MVGQEASDLQVREDSHDDSRPAKRQRNFIARQVSTESPLEDYSTANHSRLVKLAVQRRRGAMKTCHVACVGVWGSNAPMSSANLPSMPVSRPFSLGRTDGFTSRNETSMGMIFNTLRRMESKIDHLSIPTATRPSPEVSHRSESNHAPIASPYSMEPVPSNRTLPSPQTQTSRPLTQPTASGSVLSFSAHRTIHWHGVHASLPPSLSSAIENLEITYPTHLESERPSLNPIIQAAATMPTGDWLSSLSLSCVKELSNAYFDTFNRVYPFIDRDYYYLNTLAVVVREGFGYDMESCLVLNIMALGCMGLKAFEEGGFDTSQHAPITPLIRHIMEEEFAGLSFFNEARRRVGFCLCERDIQSCQYYLSSAVFFAQIMRPVDEWMMTNRASVSCAAFWKCPPKPLDEWLSDMQSRLFWSALTLESVIVQELELPSSGLKEWEETVPLPKFTTYPYVSKSRAQNSDDSYYHYHFLAQIAVRIILSRVREELYFSNPSTALAEELWHQL